ISKCDLKLCHKSALSWLFGKGTISAVKANQCQPHSAWLKPCPDIFPARIPRFIRRTFICLYQGTTSVVPISHFYLEGFSPRRSSSKPPRRPHPASPQ